MKWPVGRFLLSHLTPLYFLTVAAMLPLSALKVLAADISLALPAAHCSSAATSDFMFPPHLGDSRGSNLSSGCCRRPFLLVTSGSTPEPLSISMIGLQQCSCPMGPSWWTLSGNEQGLCGSHERSTFLRTSHNFLRQLQLVGGVGKGLRVFVSSPIQGSESSTTTTSVGEGFLVACRSSISEKYRAATTGVFSQGGGLAVLLA